MEGGTPECAHAGGDSHKVILPNGNLKEITFIDANLVREEKERILADNQIPNPSLYLMVIYGPQNSHTVMEDTEPIETYIEQLMCSLECEIHIRNINFPVEPPAKPIKPELFNFQLK